MNLRPRQKQPFSGFTKAEVQKMEQLLNEYKEQSADKDFAKNLAKVFNRSSNREGKPVLKWTEIQNWFQTNQENRPLDEKEGIHAVPEAVNQSKATENPKVHLSEETSLDDKKEVHAVPEAVNQSKATENPKVHLSEETSLDDKKEIHAVLESVNQSKATENSKVPGQKVEDLPEKEFEAKSSTDGAWYDVDRFLSHRFLDSGEMEVHVRYVGFGSRHDEWVTVKNNVRERSVTLEHSECLKLKVGDMVVCFQEKEDQARYYDSRIIDIQRRSHDIRGCRCLFLIKYDHDNVQEKVRLRRLCCRPDMLARLENS